MLGLGIVWLVQLPFTLLDVWWARRYDLTEAGYLEWALGHWFELGGAFVSLCIALLVVMFLARWLGEIWWIPGAFVFVAIGATFAFAQPYLGETTSLKNPELKRSAKEFEQKQGVSGIPIDVEDVSGTTSQANAYAVGFGPSRRVVLWSTMLDGTFSDAEVRVVLAHEIGHHSSKHIPKGIAWFALFALPGAWVLMRITRQTRRDGRGRRHSTRAPRRRGDPACAVTGADLDQPPDGSGGGLEGAADDARPGRRPRALRRLRRLIARESRPTRLGARAARQPSDPGPARGDGRGVEAAEPVGARRASPGAHQANRRITSACTRGLSRPRAA